MTWDESIERVLIPRDELVARVAELAGQISADYQGKELLLVGVLRGAVFFMADLAGASPCPAPWTSWRSPATAPPPTRPGSCASSRTWTPTSQDRHVLIVEDIIDSGLTLNYLMKNLRARHPASLEVCALLTKPARRRIHLHCKYVGFEIPDEFVVGYGSRPRRALIRTLERCIGHPALRSASGGRRRGMPRVLCLVPSGMLR